MPRILAFGYKKRSGKDSAVSFIKEHYLLNKWEAAVVHLAFADALKEHIGEGVFGLSYEQLYGADKEKIDPFWKLSPRQILQIAGTEGMRNAFAKDFDIWSKVIERQVLELPEDSLVLISDLRFLTEFQTIKRLGGQCIKVVRPNLPEDTHRSETELDQLGCSEWDSHLYNDADLATLQQRTLQLLKALHLY